MEQRTKCLIFIILLSAVLSYGQMDQYRYKRLITEVDHQWHKLPLPDSIFGKVSGNLADLRIYGLGNKNDTIEVPYILRINSEKINSTPINFDIVNTSHNHNGYYYTFEMPTEMAIDQIKLEFGEKNFDWKVELEGSQQQQQWFTLVNDYRILSIKNELTDYEFTTIGLPTSKYRFFRLLVKSDEKPNLKTAQIFDNKIMDGEYKSYPVKEVKILGNNTEKTTEITLDLGKPVPIGIISLRVREQYDYYRPINISHINDSVRTDKGWKYNYTTLFSGTLSSLEENNFDFPSTIVQKMKITVHNGDNPPLTYPSIEVKGFLHELVARFTTEATYYLVYGNERASLPDYDIAQFSENIPTTLAPLKVGREQEVKKTPLAENSPIFENKVWLWGIIALIIIVLGGFSLNMIKTKNEVSKEQF